MDKMQTDGLSAPDGFPKESEQKIIDAFEEMKITPRSSNGFNVNVLFTPFITDMHVFLAAVFVEFAVSCQL